MSQLWQKSQHRAVEIMVLSMVMNAIISVLLALEPLPLNAFTIRFSGGFFLLVFVLLHGWSRYGAKNITRFFLITLAITWSLESLSISTGFPFGQFEYTELLRDKIGAVPIMIIPAYFFNGYLAWTMSTLFVGNMDRTIKRNHMVLVPVIASCLMVFWNLSFDPIMSTIEGNWIWKQGGIYHGVPWTNFAGWLITCYLVFQGFALLVYKTPASIEPIKISSNTWYLFPIMYIIQGLPSLLYPFTKNDHNDIYQSIAWITFLLMVTASLANLAVIRWRLSNDRIQSGTQ